MAFPDITIAFVGDCHGGPYAGEGLIHDGREFALSWQSFLGQVRPLGVYVWHWEPLGWVWVPIHEYESYMEANVRVKQSQRTCVECGARIPMERLRLLPETTTCVRCSGVRPLTSREVPVDGVERSEQVNSAEGNGEK